MIKRPISLAVLVAVAALAAGCASPSHTIEKEAEARALSANAQAPSGSEFPDVSSAVWKQGAFPSIEALRSMRPGMGKDQVRERLGFPHFREGLWGVREWNYIFHFRTAASPAADYVTCQYQVRFNGDALVTGLYWKGPNCERFLQPVAAPSPAAAQPRSPERMSLSADALFRFDGAAEQDLLPEGRKQIEELAAKLRTFKQIDSVTIVGHTDRLGSEAYNRELSSQRARTVGALLARQGVSSVLITTSGAGESEPVVTCSQQERQALIACLAPNRRVDLSVRGLAN